MKNQLGIIVLILICVGLIVGLVWTQKQATTQRQETGTWSNRWMTASEALDKESKVNAELESDRKLQKELNDSLSNNLVTVAVSLEKSEITLKATQQDMTNQINLRDAKISDLESQNQVLEQRAAELSASITNLNAQIEETRKKLASAEGDKEALTKELQRQMAEKVRLEAQFNDLSVLRAQIAKVREDLNVSRRLDWQRRGLLTDQKGAEQLRQKPIPAPSTPAKQPAYDLNVEIGADGTVRVIPALTNGAAAPAPPK